MRLSAPSALRKPHLGMTKQGEETRLGLSLPCGAGEGGERQRAGWGAIPEKGPTRPLGKSLAATLPRFAEEG
jgi:hypothetical protein